MMASGSGGVTPTTAGKQMSSRLREKLKRCGRYHCSPTSVKRPHLAESPLATSLQRADNPITPSPAGRGTLKSPLCSTPGLKSRCFGDSKGKRLFQVCPPDENEGNVGTELGSIEHCLDTSATLVKSDKFEEQGCLEHCDQAVSPKRLHSQSKQNSSYRHDGASNVTKSCTDIMYRPTSDQPATFCDIPTDLDKLQELHKTFQQLYQQKQETLRKLKMVHMYRTKNNLNHLETLISKWRTVSQQALQDLHNKLPEPKPTLTELVNHLQIDHELVNFDPDEEAFS